MIGRVIRKNNEGYTDKHLLWRTVPFEHGSAHFMDSWAKIQYFNLFAASCKHLRGMMEASFDVEFVPKLGWVFCNRDGQVLDLDLLDSDLEKFRDACAIEGGKYLVHRVHKDFLEIDPKLESVRLEEGFKYDVDPEDNTVRVVDADVEIEEESIEEEGAPIEQEEMGIGGETSLEFNLRWKAAKESIDDTRGQRMESHEAIRKQDVRIIQSLLHSAGLSHLSAKDIRNGIFWSIGSNLVVKYTGSMNQWASFFYSRYENGYLDIQKRVTPLIELYKCAFVILPDPHKILFRELESSNLKGAKFREWIESTFISIYEEEEEESPSKDEEPVIGKILESSLFDEDDEEEELAFPNLENGTFSPKKRTLFNNEDKEEEESSPKKHRVEEEGEGEGEIPRPGTPILFPIVMELDVPLLYNEEEEPSTKKPRVEEE